ncbi:MAG: hypothetical protein ACFFE1_09000, partial [Candidatus Thorarchaeota archaeon]
MMVDHNERITVQHVSDRADVQEKMKVWLSRAAYNGYKVESNKENYAVVKRQSNQKFLGVIVAPIMGFFYGLFMYGSFGAIIWALTGLICGFCGVPLVKPTTISTSWNNESPFYVNVEATA